MDLPTAKQKFDDRIGELRKMCELDSPWVFVCACALVDYLARLVQGQNKGGQGYKGFVNDWMETIRPEYKTFLYACGVADLPDQMYHVLRCGIVHSLSLVPDQIAAQAGGRARSIVLCHSAEAQDKGLHHLGHYSSAAVPDAAIFVAEDFVDDIESVVDRIFQQANSDQQLAMNMQAWLTNHPLISGGF